MLLHDGATREFELGLKDFIVRLLPGSALQLNFIHIGKCGGATLWNAVKESAEIRKSFMIVSRTHTRPPRYKRRTMYLIVVRNPIDRAVSAFNWRHKLVVEEESQRSRFPGEYEILKKYQTMENIALALYDGETLNAAVASEFRSIHHLREDMNFYLGHCFDSIAPAQIYAVLCQEFLNEDIRSHLKVENNRMVHDNGRTASPDQLDLSPLARSNLRRFLARDYDCLEQLNCYFPIESHKYDRLMRH